MVILKEDGTSRYGLVTRISKLEKEVFNRVEKAISSWKE